MAAALQNGIRVRLFLIVVVSIAIRIAREHASTSVHKASGLLQTNFYIYAIVIFCSLLPYKNTWIVAIVGQTVATLLDTAAVGLGTVATLRCQTQTGCIKTLPVSVLTLVLIATALLLDTIQTWDIYRVIRSPLFVSSATQRVRILFAWALPFAWLVNILMIADSKWSMFMFTTAHLFVDPLIILMANTKEDALVSALIIAVVAIDILSFYMQTNTLAAKANLIQLGLATGALIVHWVADAPTPPSMTQNAPEDHQDTDEDFEVGEAQILRHRKSGIHKIKF